MTNPTGKNTELLAESPASFDIGKQAYIDQLRWFGGLSYQLTVQADPASIYKLIGWAGKKILGVDGYSVWLEEADEQHRCISYEGVSKEYVESVEKKPEKRPAHNVVSEIRSLYIPNITSDERTAPFHDDMKKEGLWGILHLPLQVEEKGIGRITYYFKREVDPPDYLFETARAFADQAGIAMERSRLLSETLMRVKRLEVVDEIARAVGSTMKPEDVFKTIGQGIRRAVPCSRFMIGTVGEDARSSHIWHIESDVEVDSVSMGTMEGFVQWMKKEVYQPRRPMRISDVRKKKMSWMSTRIQGGLKSYLFVPILQGDRCIGHFSLSDVKADAFTEEDEELLASVANHLSPAIRNATMFHESTEHAARLDIQNRIAKAVGSTMKPQELFQTIVREIREVVPCDRCTVGTIDRRNSRVHYWYSESDVEMEPVAEGDVDSIWWLDRVYEEKLPSNIFDYGEIDSPRARKMMESGLRSGLIVPILQDDQCIAHIALISSQAGAFSAGDESMLVSIADHMGLAMRNATLFSMAEKRASRLAVLNDLNQKITANLSLDEALKSIVRAVCDLTQGDHARILLVDEEGSQIYLRASHGDIPDPPGGPVQFAIGEGITGKVAETGEPYMVGDIQKDPSWIHKDWAREHGIHGAIFQPLRQGERVIGVITCLTCVCDFFTREELNLLESLASQAAVAIQNAQFHEEAQRSRDFFRGVVDDNATPIIVMDTERKITVWNDAAEKLYGYSADEMIGRGLERIIPEDSRADYDVITSKAIDDKDATSFETIRLRKDGTEIPVDITISPITQGDGTVLAVSAVHRDLTEQKRAQVETTRLATVMEQAGEAIMITDTEGVIEYVNPAFTEITGFERDEAIGQPPRLLKSGEMKKEFYEELWKTVSSGGVWSGQIINKKKDGAQFTARQTISPVFGSSGKIENYVSILRDITYESGLEEKLRQSQKLEALGTLAGGIAHDFNNMLTPIVGFSQMVIGKLPPGSKEREQLSQVRDAGVRAKSLVSQMLSFGRRNEKMKRPFEVKWVIKEAMSLLRASLPTTIEFQQNIRAKLSIISGDSTEFHQVIMNLGTNAGHAMQENGGVLTVELDEFDVNAEFSKEHPELSIGPHLKLVVTDTGSGIEDDVLARIFDPFFTTKGPGEGTGLGLAVVHGIVTGYGGAIFVDSIPGRGTTFEIILPREEFSIVEKKKKEEKTPQEMEYLRGDERILYVDDDEMILRMGKTMLEEMGYTVETMTESTEALEAIQQAPSRFDLIITDKTMPRLTGIMLAEEVKKIRRHLPLILCTGYNNELDLEDALKIGIRACVMKPFSTEDICGTVRKVLDEENKLRIKSLSR